MYKRERRGKRIYSLCRLALYLSVYLNQFNPVSLNLVCTYYMNTYLGMGHGYGEALNPLLRVGGVLGLQYKGLVSCEDLERLGYVP